MKFRFIAALMTLTLILTTFSGCAPYAIEARLDAAEDAFERSAEQVEKRVEKQVESAVQNVLTGGAEREKTQITTEQAQKIALEHAGVQADHAERIYTEYEIDDRIPKYEVSFWKDFSEYDYEIHAETGAVLSYERDRMD